VKLEDIRAQLGERYSIEKELGRGGMGAVYLARDRRLDRPVAIKILPPEFASQAGLRDRFLRETRTAASFSHPNIVPVYSIEEAPDFLGYAMAYVEGESLADRVKRNGPLSVRETVKLLQDTGYALAYAHGRGVVHRDIKPDNIMIERGTGRSLVMDFGISRSIAAPAPGTTQGLTRVGEVIGTPEYMSPEQATGDNVDGRSDLYSLGLTAHFALTGRPAITGDTTGRILARQITEPIPPMASVRDDVPAELAAAIDRCVEKDPANRFRTAEELVETLDVAKLSGPEIPLALRMLQQEQATLSMVIVFALFIAFLFYRLSRAADTSNGDIMLPIVILVAVLLTRVSQTARDILRLARSGYTRSDVLNGLAAILAERDQRRTELRADAGAQAARKAAFRQGVILLGVGVVMIWGALQFRHPRPGGGYNVDLPGTLLILGAMTSLGVSIPLMVRSPFKRTIGERLYRMVWLGPLGRGFIYLAGRRGWNAAVASGPTAPRRPITAPDPKPAPASGALAPDRIAALERRVSDLEAWKKSRSETTD
jgi:serine/threonine-protein kinase